jgi:hypothetical protein
MVSYSQLDSTVGAMGAIVFNDIESVRRDHLKERGYRLKDTFRS